MNYMYVIKLEKLVASLIFLHNSNLNLGLSINTIDTNCFLQHIFLLFLWDQQIMEIKKTL